MRKLFPAYSLVLILASCGGDDGHNHDDHMLGDGGVKGDVDIVVTSTSPATVPEGTTLDITWTVDNKTSDDLHVSELRYCEGADLADCGLGEQSTYTAIPGTLASEIYSASVTLDDIGMYTMVGYAHVGDFPHTSASFNVEVIPPVLP